MISTIAAPHLPPKIPGVIPARHEQTFPRKRLVKIFTRPPVSAGHVEELELEVVGIPEHDHRIGHRLARGMATGRGADLPVMMVRNSSIGGLTNWGERLKVVST
jgi:hypothetical protein